MRVKRMDNVGVVVEDIDAAIEFFTELGLELEGRAPLKEPGQTASPDCATCASRSP
jgi:catechol 2,3-dioxygenase-like lactoylglutathione lyase family enzyme